MRRPSRTVLAGCLVAALVAGACSDSGGSGSADSRSTTSAAPASDGQTLPAAPDSPRVGLDDPAFADPTNVDNPLFPIGDLHSAVLLGNDEGHPLRIETALLAEPKLIEVDGQEVETLVSQFVAYLDGRIHEVALDWYAQDDAGDRRAASQYERARVAATRNLRAVIQRAAEVHPSLGPHLEVTIRTGTYCSYEPDPRVPVDWTVD